MRRCLPLALLLVACAVGRLRGRHGAPPPLPAPGVSPDGAATWIVAIGAYEQPERFEVGRVRSRRSAGKPGPSARLDAAPDIEPGSLAVGETSAYRTRGGVPQRFVLSDG